MSIRDKKENLGQMIFNSENHIKFTTKFAILSFHQVKYHPFIEGVIVLIEYLQLVAQILFLISEATIKDSGFHEKPFFRVLIFICYIVNPFCSLNNKGDVEYWLTSVVFSLIISYLIIKYLLFFYIIKCSFYNNPTSSLLVNIWRWIFKLQGQILYFFISSFSTMVIIKASEDNISLYGINSTGIIIICAILLLAEYVKSAYLLISFSYIFPTKNFLSAKHNKIQIITLNQKFILHITQIALHSIPSSSNSWIFPSICILFDTYRNFYHFKSLPFYNIRALIYQGSLLMIVSSLSLAWIINTVLITLDSEGFSQFLWVFWIVSICFGISLSNLFIKNRILQILTKNKETSLETYANKMSIIKQARKMASDPNKFRDYYKFWYLVKETVNANIKTVFNINSEVSADMVLNIDSKESANKMFVNYLETLLVKFPKNEVLKLHLAYFYAKKLKQYGKAIKILTELKNCNQSLVELNNSLLLQDIKNIIASRYKNSGAKIDLFTYSKSQLSFAKLKQKAMKQIDLQINLCQEIITSCSRLSKILEWSKKFYIRQKRIEKTIKYMLEIIPDYFIEPLSFLTYYYYTVNHSLIDSLKYHKMYTVKFEKYKKFYTCEKLQEENLYQKDNAFMLLSGHKGTSADILFCSKSIERIYGEDAKLFIGKNISLLSPPPLQSFTLSDFKFRIENENHSNFDTVFNGYGWHREGYMFEVNYYLNVFPDFERGFCFATIVRKTKSKRDLILINHDGNIEASTKKIKERLGLNVHFESSPKKILNVKLLSDELDLANRALNMKAISNGICIVDQEVEIPPAEKPSLKYFESDGEKTMDVDIKSGDHLIDLEKAKELRFKFLTEGKDVALKSFINNKSFLYHCNISNLRDKWLVSLESRERDDEGAFKKKHKVEKTHPGLKDLDPVKIESKRIETADSNRGLLKSPLHKLYNIERNGLIKNESLIIAEKVLTESSNLISFSGSEIYKKSVPNEHHLRESKFKERFTTEFNTCKKQDIEELEQNKIYKADPSILGSPILRSLKHKNIFKAFNEAVKIKSCKKGFKALCFLFYFLLICLFGIQLNIMISWDDGLHALKVKKDILNNALLRNYYAADLPAFFIILVGMDNKKLDLETLGETSMTTFGDIEDEGALLLQTNNALLADTTSLSQEMRENLFDKDVRVFDSCQNCSEQLYIMVDNFQATNMILEHSHRLIPAAKENVSAVKEEINFFSQNCLNDLMIKNTQISEIFLESLNDQKDEILSYAKVCLVFSLSFLGIIIVSMTIIIRNNYLTEKQNLSMFVKVDLVRVNETLMTIKNFKSMLNEGTNFEDCSFEDLYSFDRTIPSESLIKHNSLKKPDSRGLARKYYLHLGKVACAIVILCGLTSWGHFSVLNFIKNIYEKQSQLYFINLVRSRTNLIGHALNVLLSVGTDQKIENKPILTFFSDAIEELIDLRTRLTQVLPMEISNKDPDVKKILFDDACQLLDSYFDPYCSLIKMYGISSGFIEILTNFEKLAIRFNDEYPKVNATNPSFYLLPSEPVSIFFSIWTIITAGDSFALCERIDISYEKMLIESINHRYLIFGVFVAVLVKLMIFIWIFVLKDLKEVNNRFKKVLRMLPPDLIFSNFFLKSFLIQTSKGALDGI